MIKEIWKKTDDIPMFIASSIPSRLLLAQFPKTFPTAAPAHPTVWPNKIKRNYSKEKIRK